MNDDQTPVVLPSFRGAPPSTPTMTACQVLTWIAVGEALTKEKLGESEREDLLQLVAAMGDKDEEPCAIELVESDTEVRETWAVWNTLERAQRELLQVCQSGKKLQASGCNHRGEYVSPIPVQVFKDPRNELTWFDTIESDPTVKSPYKRGPARPFTDVEFETAAVMELWPPAPADEGDGVRAPAATAPAESLPAQPIPVQKVAEMPAPVEPSEASEPDAMKADGTTADVDSSEPAHADEADGVQAPAASAEASMSPAQKATEVFSQTVDRGCAQEGPSLPTPSPARNVAEVPLPAGAPEGEDLSSPFHAESTAPTPLPTRGIVSPKRDVPRVDYREADKELIAEMRAMIADGRANSPTSAARAVAKRAASGATEASKVVRLVRHYHDQRSSDT
jgi:hypothetical protein